VSHRRDPLPTRVQGLPPLPAAYHATLDSGLADLGVMLTRAQREAIDGHAQLLLAWTPAINLTAIRDPVDVARLHVVDSLTAVPLVQASGGAFPRLLDLGSGGGYPGVPLAVALDAEALLVDSVAKKARFLETVMDALALDRVRVAAARAEALGRDLAHREAWPLVTARAVAPLAELVELAFPLLEPGGRLVAWKRGDLGGELAPARRATRNLGGGSLETHAAGLAELPDHRLVVVTKSGTTPDGWPRDPAARRRRPW
jgi:16S rRNA (guanine527-N7)-methyltransferase